MTDQQASAPTHRRRNEVNHGKYLAEGGAEAIWGWGTPAGRLRAERRAALIAQGGRLGPGANVLEIGCGTGLFTEYFARTGARLIAVDLSSELLEIARAKDLQGVEFREQPFETCDLDGPFDAVVASSVLHHLELPDAWTKIFALLKPGGYMSLAEPNMLNPQIYAERHFRSWFPQVSPDETAFVRWQVRRVLERAGFRDVRITPFDWLHPATPRPFIPVVRGIGRVFESMPLVREFSGSLWITARRPA